MTTTTTSSVAVPTSGCYLGTTVRGQNLTHLAELDGYINPKKFAVVRAFAHVDSFSGGKVPGFIQRCGDQGKLVVLSINAELKSGQLMPWKSMASGAQDSYLADWATALNAYPYPMLLTYTHEPYFNATVNPGIWSGGTPPKYCKASATTKDSIAGEWLSAFNYIMSYLQGAGVSNVRYFPDWSTEYCDNFARWLPARYDWLFNDSFAQNATQTFAQANADFYTWAHANHPTVPLGVGACSLSGTDAQKAAWYASVPVGLASQPQMKIFNQWDGSPWYGSTLPQTYAAFVKMAQGSVFSPT
jgi:hypothetical protein